ncbi:hypothetical protein H6P81_000566 [Aristolochia fimbriata]|uniref:Uncharacterized protein n=1 Tax=Aristolochia fimbriata TaxID=158543 RepID=A0AAV7F4Z7_ARIFI|nr:hypothetical protein H6P81_000566 [Aristolochia fimbriata]
MASRAQRSFNCSSTKPSAPTHHQSFLTLIILNPFDGKQQNNFSACWYENAQQDSVDADLLPAACCLLPAGGGCPSLIN